MRFVIAGLERVDDRLALLPLPSARVRAHRPPGWCRTPAWRWLDVAFAVGVALVEVPLNRLIVLLMIACDVAASPLAWWRRLWLLPKDAGAAVMPLSPVLATVGAAALWGLLAALHLSPILAALRWIG